jgi:O-antigen/teichoic acid export membrane protein
MGAQPDLSPAEAPPAPHFADRVRSAVVWRWGSQVTAQIITWTATLIVVRLLSPHDYGLFAMTQAVLTGLNFLNGYAYATSLIQSREVDERRIGQVFGMLLASNGLLAAVQFLIAPFAAAYYGQPIVADMLRVQALVFLATPFIALPSELLAKSLDFRRQALVNLASATLGASVALVLAWRGHGVWALVLSPITAFYVRAIGLTLVWGRFVRPVFDFRGAREVFGFGATLTLVQLCWIVQSQSDIVIAGRMFSTHDLGLYAEALFLTLILTGRFLPPLNEVAFPAYAELAHAGRPLGPAFLAGARLIMLVALPFYVGMSLAADPLVRTFFGPKWIEMIPIVAGLAIVMPAMALQIVCSPATNALGRPRVYLFTATCGAVLMPVCYWLGAPHGVMGLVNAWHVAAPALLAITLAATLPRIGVRLGDLAAALLPAVVCTALMAAAVTGIDRLSAGLPALARVALLVGPGVLVYLAGLRLLWPAVFADALAKLRGSRAPVAPPRVASAPGV